VFFSRHSSAKLGPARLKVLISLFQAMAQGKLKLKSKSTSQAKKKQQAYKNKAAKTKRGTSNVISSKKPNVQQQQKVMKSLTKAINAKAETDLKARSFQSDGKSFKMLGKVEVAQEKVKGAKGSKASGSKGKVKSSGKKKKK